MSRIKSHSLSTVVDPPRDGMGQEEERFTRSSSHAYLNVARDFFSQTVRSFSVVSVEKMAPNSFYGYLDEDDDDDDEDVDSLRNRRRAYSADPSFPSGGDRPMEDMSSGGGDGPAVKRTRSRQDTGKEHAVKTTNCQTMMHLIKGNVGTGVLAIPNSFKYSGILVGMLTLPLLGVICIHCMHSLTWTCDVLCKRFRVQTLNFAQVAEKAFEVGPRPFRRFSKFMYNLVNGFVLLTQFGFMCVYFLFVGDTIRKVLDNVLPHNPLSIYAILGMVLPFMVLYSFLRNLRQLAVASVIANLLQIVGIFVIFSDLLQGLPPVSHRPLTADISVLPLYFGISVYAFEGIGMVLPLRNEMQAPKDFGGWNGVLNTGMVVVACFYTGIGFFGFLKYGMDVKDSITFNPPHTPFFETVRLMFAVAIFLSFGLQLYVPFQIFFPWFKKKYRLQHKFSRTRRRLIEYAFKTLIVIITFGFSVAIPHLDLFISLVGALASSSLALIFPPLLELFAFWEEDMGRGKKALMIAKNCGILLLGVLGFLTGTYASIVAIVAALQAEENSGTEPPV